ncbi:MULTISPECIES: hypothetical protein [Mesorhizobium]|uniref:Lipoprotein n=2 Tax=Mesorhizobium TaxID=68287 RepID=A0A1A5I0Q1_RHILI|nr:MULTISPECIES: hypothetical protein [Mesorhizobium]ETA72898.1 hypothetical protein MesloDRAFT_1790 [Mesorhizobium japonicum R7A]MBE1710042.1 hypothetical protein [Mesorhizobium japonicum]MBE1716686.1 hypothetical protein [Mesorhizobium japonicum]MUT25404.1 hypothetical protein [Mesorhizobium japonicum]MUT28988.1 hypothetical protein [Mesorhizobium japonicum]
MRKTVQLLLVASLCGCVAPRPDAGDQHVDPIPFSLALEEVVITGIRQRLPDPASARLGRTLAGERTLNGRKEIVVCGFVNGEDPSGGSGGEQAFIARIYPDSATSFDLVAMGSASETRRLVDRTCSAAGLPISDSA